MIYHIARAGDWRAALAAETYAADTLATQGFIHCSDREQVTRVADALFRGATDLVLLTLDPTRLAAETRYETGDPPSSERFPHVYGPLNLAAVVGVAAFPPGPDGRFALPV